MPSPLIWERAVGQPLHTKQGKVKLFGVETVLFRIKVVGGHYTLTSIFNIPWWDYKETFGSAEEAIDAGESLYRLIVRQLSGDGEPMAETYPKIVSSDDRRGTWYGIIDCEGGGLQGFNDRDGNRVFMSYDREWVEAKLVELVREKTNG